MNKLNRFAVFAATAGVCFLVIQISGMAGCVNREPEAPVVASRSDSVSMVFDGLEWSEILDWRFADGWYPAGWGWGRWKVADGVLQGDDRDGNIAVYFFPFTHGGNTLLETKVKFIRSTAGHHVEAQLLTRDDKAIHSESGMVILAEQDSLHLRHMVRTIEYVAQAVPIDTVPGYGEWHVMRFMFHGGKVDVFLNDDRVYSSAPDDTLSRAASSGGVWPVAVYHEPHLAVRWGVAAFEYVKVFSIPSDTSGAAAAPTRGTIPARTSGRAERHWFVTFLLWLFYAVIVVVCLYVVRHYVFTLNRLFGRQRQPYLDVDDADWPEVTVVVPAHNEEVVIAEILEALLDVDYPKGRLTIMPIDDRSKDATGDIIEAFAARHPGRFRPFHRRAGKAGKAAALNHAIKKVETDVVLIFDADYVPGRGLIKQLVAPFFDPEVGAVMGRVVPYNVDTNLLTRLLDLERAGGYQVDQQARMNMKMVPQYGGTVGGVRKRALLAVGGWRADSLAEDTDATYRLLEGGWKTVYQNRSECYEQVPETWTSRVRQIMRWAKGHNQATARYSFSLLGNRRTSWAEKLDGLLLLGVYLMSPILLLGWALGIILWYMGEPRASLVIILAVTSYSTMGNFAVFFEITAAAQLDGSRERIRLLPFVMLGFLVSLFSVTRAAFSHVAINGNGKNGNNGDVVWDKTERKNSFNGHMNGNGNGHKNGHKNGDPRKKQ